MTYLLAALVALELLKLALRIRESRRRSRLQRATTRAIGALAVQQAKSDRLLGAIHKSIRDADPNATRAEETR